MPGQPRGRSTIREASRSGQRRNKTLRIEIFLPKEMRTLWIFCNLYLSTYTVKLCHMLAITFPSCQCVYHGCVVREAGSGSFPSLHVISKKHTKIVEQR